MALRWASLTSVWAKKLKPASSVVSEAIFVAVFAHYEGVEKGVQKWGDRILTI